MKPIHVREILLLTLPVTLLGGGAWIRWQGAFGQFPERLSRGKPRLAMTGLQSLPLSAFDVGSGISWSDGENWPQPFKIKIPLYPGGLDKFTGNPHSTH